MKLRYLFVLPFICLCVIGFSQSPEYVDSLQQALKNATEDTTKVDLRYKIGSASRTFRTSFWDSIVADAHNLKMYHVEAECLNNIGFIYNMQGFPDSSLVYFHKSLGVSEGFGDKEAMANSLNSIGYIYRAQGNISEALNYYHRSLKILEEMDLKQGMGVTLNNIGVIHDNQQDSYTAIEFYEKSLAIRKEVDDKSGVATCLNNIGNAYGDIAVRLEAKKVQNKDSLYRLSLEYHKRSLKIREEIEDDNMIPNSLNNIAGTFKYLARLPGNEVIKDSLELLSFQFFQRGLEMSTASNNMNWQTYSLNGMAQFNISNKNYKEAKAYALKSFNISNDLGYPDRIKEAASILSEIYMHERNFEKALEMYALEIDMRDSILNLETERSTIQQQTKFEYDKQFVTDSIANEGEKKILVAQVAAEELKTAKEKQAKYYLYGGLGFLALFGLFIFNRFKVSQKQNKLIHKQKDEIHEQKDLIEERNKEVMDSIVYAQRLQQAILPSKEEMHQELKNGFVLFQPKDVVSGDFYWMALSETKGKIYFAAADCTGHGVPGAMVSVVCSNALDRAVNEFNLKDTGEILDKVTDLVISRFEKSGEEVKDGMDIALCSIDFTTNKLQYSGANNPLWIVKEIQQNQQFDNKEIFNESHFIKEYKATKQPVGKFALRSKFQVVDVDVKDGETIYLFTDGYVDQFGGARGKKFKHKPFKKLLLDINSKDMNLQKGELTNNFNSWKGDLEQIDDVCVIGVRI